MTQEDKSDEEANARKNETIKYREEDGGNKWQPFVTVH